jgi:hypothetical protein
VPPKDVSQAATSGVWRSLVARLLWEQQVAGSNPAAPTTFLAKYGVTVNAISPGAATRMTASIPTDRRRSGLPDANDEWSPDNVAPVVAYLASERSGWITGRVIHSSGYEVSLYNNPEPISRIIGTGPWDADALSDQVERAFGPLLGRKN